MKSQKPKGTVDQYPTECALRLKIFDIFRLTAAKFNFQEVESPAFEELNLLTEKEGEETKKQIFTLEQRGEEKFGLRFDLTVPLARMFLQKQKELPKPVKWSYCTRMWRYERPQKGRLREFYQMGVEILGSKNPEADAEMINLAIQTLYNLGLTTKEFIVNINNRKLLEGILQDRVSKEFLQECIRIIDKREKIDQKEFEDLLKEIKVKDAKEIIKILDLRKIEDIGKLKLNPLAQEGLEELKAIYELVDQDVVQINLSTARGLAYYTGTVFEIFDINNKYRSMCGGGRYDKMVELFGGEPTPATGFGMGLSTLTLVLKDFNKLPKTKEPGEYYIAPVDEKLRPKAIEIARKLRKKTSVEVDLMRRSLSKQLQYAAKNNFQKLIIVGDKDLKNKQVTVKDLKTGDEEKVFIENL